MEVGLRPPRRRTLQHESIRSLLFLSVVSMTCAGKRAEVLEACGVVGQSKSTFTRIFGSKHPRNSRPKFREKSTRYAPRTKSR